MTNREFYEKVIAAAIDTETTEHAQALLTKLDETNAKRAEKAAEKNDENVAEARALVAYLNDKPQTASDLMNAAGASVQKTSYLLRLAVKLGHAQVTDVKVAKKGTQKGYFVDGTETPIPTDAAATTETTEAAE